MSRREYKPDRPMTVGRKWLLTLTALAVVFGGVGLLTITPTSFKISAETGDTASTPIATYRSSGDIKGDNKPATTVISFPGEREGTTEFRYHIPAPKTGTVKKIRIHLNDSYAIPKAESYSGQSGGYSVDKSLTVEKVDNYLNGATTVQNSWLQEAADSKVSSFSGFSISYDIVDDKDNLTGRVRENLVDENNKEVDASDVSTKAQEARGDYSVKGTTYSPPNSDSKDACGGVIGSNIVKWAICNMVVSVVDWMANTISGASKWVMDTINDWIKNGGIILSSWVNTAWGTVRNIVDVIAVVILIIVAFANILHINLNTYAVKRMLPLFIGSVIGANLSLFAIKAAMALSYQFAGSLTTAAGDGFGGLAGTIGKVLNSVVIAALGLGGGPTGTATGGVAAATLAGAILLSSSPIVFLIFSLLFVIAIAVMVIIAFLIFIQPGVVGILTIVAPLAIIASVLPSTQGVFKKWLGMTVNWIFMLPISLMIFALMKVMMPETDNWSTLSAMFSVVGQIILLIFAIRIPFTMGGDIAKGWGAAGMFIGKQAYNRSYAGALGAQPYQKKIDKETSGMNAKQKAEYMQKQGLRGRWRYRYAKSGLAAGVANWHPQAFIAGRKKEEERLQGMIGGLQPAFSKRYGKMAGKGEVFANDRDSQAGKAQLLSQRDLLSRFLSYQDGSNKKFKLTPEQKRSAITESPGAFEGYINSGAQWKNVPAENTAEVWATVREMFKRASMSQYGELAFPAITGAMIKEGLTDSLSDFALAVANINEDAANRGESVMSNADLDEELKRRYGEKEDDIKKPRERIRKMQERWSTEGRQGRGRRDDGVPDEQQSGLEAGVEAAEPTEDDLRLPHEQELDESIVAAIRQANSSTARINGDVESRLRGVDSTGSVPVTVAEPVSIDNSSELQVVDNALRNILDRMSSEVVGAMKDANVDPQVQAQVIGAMRQIQVSPEDVAQIVSEQGIKTSEGGHVKLAPTTDILFRRFVTTATRGTGVMQETARDYFRKNLSDVMPYTEHITKEIRGGRLNPADLSGVEKSISTQLDMVRGGAGLSEAQLLSLRQTVKRVSPGAELSLSSANDLLRIGPTMVSALQKMQTPEVARALQLKANPQQVQDVIVKQAAQGLVRQTAVGRIDAIVQQAQKPVTLRIQEAARQIGSFAANSSLAGQWGAIGVAAKQMVATEVARQVVGQKKADETAMREELEKRLAGIKPVGRAAPSSGGRPVTPTAPSLNAPGTAPAPGSQQPTLASVPTPPVTPPPTPAPPSTPQPPQA